jgi:hypothetical protein
MSDILNGNFTRLMLFYPILHSFFSLKANGQMSDVVFTRICVEMSKDILTFLREKGKNLDQQVLNMILNDFVSLMNSSIKRLIYLVMLFESEARFARNFLFWLRDIYDDWKLICRRRYLESSKYRIVLNDFSVILLDSLRPIFWKLTSESTEYIITGLRNEFIGSELTSNFISTERTSRTPQTSFEDELMQEFQRQFSS